MSNKKNIAQENNLQWVKIDRNEFAVQLIQNNMNVNLTQMSKPFGRSKRPLNWLMTMEAQEYIHSLSVAKKLATEDLIIVKQGGTNQGTWCTDYRIAMRFAQWLNPDFAVKVDTLLVTLMVNSKKTPNRVPVKRVFAELKLPLSQQRMAAMRGAHPTEFVWENGQWFTNAEYAEYIKERLHVESMRRTLYVKKLKMLTANHGNIW